MAHTNKRIEAMPATRERALAACQRYADLGWVDISPAIVDEAAWLLLEWWQAAERHDIGVIDLAHVVSLPVAAMDVMRARARS